MDDEQRRATNVSPTTERDSLVLFLNTFKTLDSEDARLVAIQSFQPNERLARLLRDVDTFRSQIAALRIDLGQEHPRVRAEQERLVSLNEAINDQVDAIVEAAEMRLRMLNMRLADLKQKDSQPFGLSAEQRKLYEEELALLEQQVATAQEQFQAGVLSKGDLIRVQREKIQIERELARLEAASESQAPSSTHSAPDPQMTAEEAEELRRVQALVANSPDLIDKPGGSDGLPPLHTAIWKGHLNVVRYLLANGVSTSVKDKFRRTPLHVAASKGQLSALRLLLDTGVDINQPSGEGTRAAHAATESANYAVISFLVEEGVDLDAQDDLGHTVLHNAAERGDAEAIELLIAGGADMEVRSFRAEEVFGRSPSFNSNETPFDATPLCFAVRATGEQVVDLLLERGADPSPKVPLSSTPIYRAVSGGNTNIVHRLVDAGSVTTNSPLVHMALERMPMEIPFLLDSGADPNLTLNPTDEPVLLVAISQFLNQWYSRIDEQRREDRSKNGALLPPTTLSGSRQFSSRARSVSGRNDQDADWETIVKQLVEHGADVNVVHGRHTVLMKSCQGSVQPLAMIEWLLNKGANPNLGGGAFPNAGTYFPPLFWATGEGRLELAELFIKHGAKLGAREDIGGTTPLHGAAGNHHTAVVELLLENGADPNEQDAYGMSPLYSLLKNHLIGDNGGQRGPFRTMHMNRGYGSDEMIAAAELEILNTLRALLVGGARSDKELDAGFLPIHFAASISDTRILELFLETGANPNSTNSAGITPLHIAACKGETAPIIVLAKAGADLNQPDENGDTPLHYSAMTGRVAATEALINLGADKEAMNSFSLTPAQSPGGRKYDRPGPFGQPIYHIRPKDIADVLGE